MKTLREVARYLVVTCDIETICELLDIDEDDIVEAFMDNLEERLDYVKKELDLDTEADVFDNDEDSD